MNYLKMKARTRDGAWFEFDVSDIPTMFTENEFALFARPGTPLLNRDVILRGDSDFDLYEGDIISIDGHKWMCCYERGFYLIDEEYNIKYFDELKDFERISNYYDAEFPVHLTTKKKHLFKVRGSVFRLEDIIGGTNDDRIFVRGFNRPIEVNKIRQECCIVKDNNRLFFGDMLPSGRVILKDGRIKNKLQNGTYEDLALRRVADDRCD